MHNIQEEKNSECWKLWTYLSPNFSYIFYSKNVELDLI